MPDAMLLKVNSTHFTNSILIYHYLSIFLKSHLIKIIITLLLTNYSSIHNHDKLHPKTKLHPTSNSQAPLFRYCSLKLFQPLNFSFFPSSPSSSNSTPYSS